MSKFLWQKCDQMIGEQLSFLGTPRIRDKTYQIEFQSFKTQDKRHFGSPSSDPPTVYDESKPCGHFLVRNHVWRGPVAPILCVSPYEMEIWIHYFDIETRNNKPIFIHYCCFLVNPCHSLSQINEK